MRGLYGKVDLWCVCLGEMNGCWVCLIDGVVRMMKLVGGCMACYNWDWNLEIFRSIDDLICGIK